MAALRDCFFSLSQEQLDAKVRLDGSSEQGILRTIALAGFESPRPGAEAGQPIDPADRHPLHLSDEGDLPLSTRMAKVFTEPLSLAIVGTLHGAKMSPSQLHAKFGGPSVRSFHRRCETLTDLGWLVRLGSETDGPPIFYTAAGPEAFDADLWGGIPEAATKAESWPIFNEFFLKAEEALREGSFNAREDRHLSFCTFLLDARGWGQVKVVLNRCDQALRMAVAESRARAERGSHLFLATLFLAAFEDPQGDFSPVA